MRKTHGRRVFASVLYRFASVLGMVSLLYVATLSQVWALDFRVTEPGQTDSQLISSTMAEFDSAVSVLLCVPDCVTGSMETKPNGTLQLPDGASWQIEESGNRECARDASGLVMCTEQWKVILTAPPLSSGSAIANKYSASVEIRIADEVVHTTETTDLLGVYEPPRQPAEISFEKPTYAGDEGDIVEIVLVRTGDTSQLATAVTVTIDEEPFSSGIIAGEDYTLSSRKLTWAASEGGRKIITARLLADDEIEEIEEVGLYIGEIDGADDVGAEYGAVLSINDAPAPPVGTIQFALAEAEVLETAGIFIAELTRTGGNRSELSVLVDAIEGTAKAGDDFVKPGSPTLVRWADGDATPKQVRIPIISDTISESTERFSLSMVQTANSPLNTVGTTASMVVDILNVVPPQMGSVEFSAANYTVGENDGTVELTIVRSGGRVGAIDIILDTEDGSASAGLDYTGTDSSSILLSWADGEVAPKTATIPILRDDETEGDETFSAFLSGSSLVDAERLGDLTETQITITDAPPLPRGTVQMASRSITVQETDAVASLQVTRTGGTAGEIRAFITTADRDAISGADYVGIAPRQLLTWLDGDDDPKTVEVELISDNEAETTEFFEVNISTGDDLSILGSVDSTIVTIEDVPPASAGTLQFAASRMQVSETDGIALVQVTRTGGSAGSISAIVSSADDSASDGLDYVGISTPSVLTWGNDDISPKTVEVTLLTDDLNESDEIFNLQLSDVSGSDSSGGPSVLGSPTSMAVLIEDVPPVLSGTVQLASDSIVVSETDGTASVLVTRSGGSAGRLTALVSTRENTAIDGADFIGITPSTSLTWEDGDVTPQTVSVTLLTDELIEDDEFFEIVLSDPIVAQSLSARSVLGSVPSTIVTITDAPPAASGTIQMASDSITVSEADATATIQVTRTGGTAGRLTVQVMTEDNTASDGADFTGLGSGQTLTWGDGDRIAKTVDIKILTDELLEDDEDFSVFLIDPQAVPGEGGGTESNILGSPTTTQVIITDVAPAPRGTVQFTVAETQIQENAGELELQVTRIGGSRGEIRAAVSTKDVTAAAGVDYTGLALPMELRWVDGDTATKLVSIPILTDDIVEPTEIFEVLLTTDDSSLIKPRLDRASLGEISTVTVEILDVSPTPAGVIEFASASVDVQETAGEVVVSVVRNGGSRGSMTAMVSSVADTATAGEDFTGIASPISLVWADGETDAKTVTIEILSDTIVEPTESFALQLTDPEQVFASARALGAQTTTTINILNVDPPARGTIQFADTEIEASETDGSVSLAVTRRDGTAGAISVLLSTADVSATSGADYLAIDPPIVLSWADGEGDTKTVTVDLLSDSLSEPDETFNAILSVRGEGDTTVLGADNQATVTITDVEPPPRGTVQFTTAAVDTSETEGRVLLQVSRQGGSAGSISVTVSSNDGSARSGEDYTGLDTPLRLSWADGETDSKDISIAILADDLSEPDENFSLTLAEPGESASNVIGEPSSTTITIMNIDPALPGNIAFAASDISVRETDGSVRLTVNRSGGSDGRVSARLITRDGSAINGQDYTGITDGQLLVWEDGDATGKTVDVPITNDEVSEPLENFTAALSLVSEGEETSNAGLGENASMRIDIVNVDPAARGVIEFAASSVSVLETDGAVRLQVVRSGGSAGAIRAFVTTREGSATEGSDYTAPSEPIALNWADGESAAKTVDITVLADSIREETETFDVLIALPAESDPDLLGEAAQARVSISDVTNDVPGSISFSVANQSVSESSDNAVVVLQRSGGADGAVSVNVLTTDGSATANEDYTALIPAVTVSWADGDIADKTLNVPILNDSLLEESETFSLQLSAVDGSELGSIRTQTVTINDTTTAGVIAFATASVATTEDSGTISLIVNRQDGSDGAISVDFTTVADTAEADADFTATSGTLNWLAGDTSAKTIDIDIIDDAFSEASEQFSVVLSNARPFGDVLLGSPVITVVTVEANTEAPTDAGQISVVSDELTIAEDSGTIQLAVSRTNASNGAVSVDYQLLADTATAGDDYIAASGTLNWADGESGTQEIDVQILTDGIEEEVEQFSLVLSNAQAPANHLLSLDSATTQINITDTTERGMVQMIQSTLIVSEADAVAVVQVERVDGADGELAIGLNIVGQTAEPGVDFTAPTTMLRWNDGESGIKELRIAITADNEAENDETFTLELLVENEPETVNNNARNLLVIIRDSSITTRAPVELVIVSGDNQVGDPGDDLEPLVLEAQNEAGVPVNEPTTINWSVDPPGSAELSAGTETVTDNEGQTSNQVRILSNGFIRIVATVVKEEEITTQATSRIDPAPLALSPGQIAFTIRAGLQARPGLSRNQSATGAALDDGCDAIGVDAVNEDDRTPAQQDLLTTCQQLLVSTTLAADLDRLGHEEYFVIADSVVNSAEIQLTNIYSRINALRSGRYEQLDLKGLQLSIFDQSIPGSVINAAQNAVSSANNLENEASSESMFSKLGFFASGSISKGEVDGDGIEQDTDITTRGITIGADYRLSDSVVIGAGLGFIQNETEFSRQAGGADVNGVNLTLFGTWYESDKGYLDLVVDIGQNSYEIERQLNITGTPRALAQAETDASVIAINLGAGKNFQRGGWEFGPYARVSAINASVDGFSETVDSQSSFGSALDVQSHEVKSVSVSIGGQLSKSISTGFGVMLPQLRIELESENETRKDGITASFSADPESTPFTLEGQERDSAFANIGLGTSLVFRNGKSAYVFYETRAASEFVTQHWLKFGFRAEF